MIHSARTTVAPVADHYSHLKMDGQKYGWSTCVKIVLTTGVNVVWPRGSILLSVRRSHIREQLYKDRVILQKLQKELWQKKQVGESSYARFFWVRII